MNMLTIKKLALGLAITTATTFAANAQKSYTQGTVSYDVSIPAFNITGSAKVIFTADSSAMQRAQGPASITVIISNNGDYCSVFVNIPVLQRKVAAVMTPGEIEEEADKKANYTFTATTETKKIGDYNCTKYIAKESKTNANYDVWITKDLTLPANIMTIPFKSLPGTPVEFPTITPNPANGQLIVQDFKLSGVSADKPANAFTIPSDYTRISYSEMMAMSGRRQ